MKIITKNSRQTQKIGEDLAKYILEVSKGPGVDSGDFKKRPRDSKSLSYTKIPRSWKIRIAEDAAIALGLSGNLGGGKTTFLQGFAKGLRVKEKILSPTFVIMKRFELKNNKFSNFYHIDCYRLKDHDDILELMGFSAKGGPASGWKDIISNPKNIVAVEWPEKIKRAMPKSATTINFKFISENKREIKFKM